MDTLPPQSLAPDEWLAVLDDSAADLAVGRIVSGEAVIRDLQDGLSRLEARHGDTAASGAKSQV